MNTELSHSDTYTVKMKGSAANCFIAILIAMITSIVPLFLNREPAVYETSLQLFITVVILFYCVIRYYIWGIVASILTYIIYGIVKGLDTYDLLINILVNTIEIIMMLIAYVLIKRIRTKDKEEPDEYEKGIFEFTWYNMFLIVLFVLYFSLCILVVQEKSTTILIAFAAATFISTAIKIAVDKDKRLLWFTLGVALIPSAIACLLSIWFSRVSEYKSLDYFLIWTLSNYILLQTGGYVIFRLLYNKSTGCYNDSESAEINASTVAYYIAIIIWNALIIYLFYHNQLKLDNLFFFFPWMLGNVFFLMNLIFSGKNDSAYIKEKFKWYENRAVVAEENTNKIISMITFILPLSAALLDTPPTLVYLFVINIFCACMTVGLVWVPANNVRMMALVKTLKTIFHLFTITILLICVIMIMFSPKKSEASGAISLSSPFEVESNR